MTIEDLVHERGPLTLAAFMDLALYHAESGYYARAVQRSGRAGDFFTSVDVGPLFGELIAAQIEEMASMLAAPFDLVEAGAGNGRLSADILRALRRTRPDLYGRLRLHLVEESAAARAGQRDALGEAATRLVSAGAELPESFEGVLLANELLDAMPVHQVVRRRHGLREIYVVNRQSPAGGPRVPDADRVESAAPRLSTVEGPLSTPALAEYLARVGVVLEPGWRAEINLKAVAWIRQAARRLRRGFLLIVDYGHEAHDLYSASHSAGTLTTFSGHRMAGPERPDALWLQQPGAQDLTAHVDFTSVRAAAEAEGLATLAFLDQTYFLLGLLDPSRPLGLAERLALKTLTLPGGLGSTHKVLILGKNVGRPSLRGCSFSRRVT